MQDNQVIGLHPPRTLRIGRPVAFLFEDTPMSTPPTHSVIKEKGITGCIRARRQWLTGKPVLQVEVVQERETIMCGQVISRRYSLLWRDADMQEAFQVQHGIGFTKMPADEALPLQRPAPTPPPPARR